MIDTRDLNTRLNEYEDAMNSIADLEVDICDLENGDEIEALEQEIDCYRDDIDEVDFGVLQSIREEVPEFENGTVLISDDEWVEYVKEMLKGDEIVDDVPDYVVIDWDATADMIQQDYSCVDYQDETYWYRAY